MFIFSKEPDLPTALVWFPLVGLGILTNDSDKLFNSETVVESSTVCSPQSSQT